MDFNIFIINLLFKPYKMAKQILSEEFRRMQELAGVSDKEKTTKSASPADVKALGQAQKSSQTIQNKAKNINTIQEFPKAFEIWFKSLGYDPSKITKNQLRSEVEKTLIRLRYK